MRKRVLTSALLFSLLSPAYAETPVMTPEERAVIEEVVREYLLKNPEILREMAQTLEAKEKQEEEEKRGKALVENKDAIFRSDLDPVIGNPRGDITVVEFLDYNCGWCKKSVAEVATLVGQDKNLRIVMKEFPIFGEGSEYAAKAALAAGYQGKYWEMHQALFAHEGPVTADVANQIAEGLGLDMVKLKADIGTEKMANIIRSNQQLAQTLLINGTPAFIIDDQIVPGYLPHADLAATIAKARRDGCKMC